MGLVKLTFDGSTIQSKEDAYVNHFNFGNQNGVINGAGNISGRIENNYIIFTKGYLSIYGRIIFVEEGTKIYVSMDSNKKGVVFVDIDLTDNSVTLDKAEMANEYPTLISEDLLKGGTRHQFPIYWYEKTTSSIKRTYPAYVLGIYDYNERVNGLWDDVLVYVDENLEAKCSSIGSYNYKFEWEISEYTYYSNYTKWLFIVRLRNNYYITIPGQAIFTGGGSTRIIKYEIGGIAYSMTVEIYAGVLYLTAGATSHYIYQVYMYR